MREQILTGITNAANAAYGNHLADLSSSEIEAIADAVLAALAEVPEGTPTPEPVVAPAQVAFTIDPAMVVARQARQSLDSVLAAPVLTRGDVEALMDGDYIDAVPSAEARETREFLFAVQEMFGCKVRCVRSEDEREQRRFIVVGNDAQRAALIETLASFKVYAEPLLAGLDTTERREFWATLGQMIAATDDAAVLIDDNRENYVAACTMMIDSHGPARTLNRADAATEGTIYDLASAVVAR